ncbi:Serine/threonine-protein kinase dclk3 [Tulasnella sp. UAMH 9824]|nr:Serine/threonine-protein kinase dclk3 [Tulasnella sp. UAMH 9824]
MTLRCLTQKAAVASFLTGYPPHYHHPPLQHDTAGGKRPVGKAKFTGQVAQDRKFGNAAQIWHKDAQAKPQVPSRKTRDRKRDRQPDSDSEGLDILPNQKKTKLSHSLSCSNFAVSGLQSSRSAQDASFDEEAQKVALDFTKSSSEDGHDPSAQSPSPETAPILTLASEPQDETSAKSISATTDQHETALPTASSSSTHPNLPLSGPETVLVEDLTSRHADLGISFGRLQCLTNPKVFFILRKPDDGREAERILVGYDRRGCDFVVSGPAQGIGPYHCYLNMELRRSGDGPLRRRVFASKIQTVDPSLRTTIWIAGVPYLVEDDLALPPGAIIQFGNGEKYAYYGPEFSALYFQEQQIHDRANSGVTRVKRKNDRAPFVAKLIRKSHSEMAETEIAVYKALDSHPRIVQLVEAFHEGFSGAYHLLLEAGEMDLHQYASRTRVRGQNILNANASRWIEEITRGVEYLHRHNIAHRDMKPKNIIVFISKTEGLTMKLGDMGLARPNTKPVIKNWFAGTDGWLAPGAFMAYGDDRFADCYGVGRLLFFLLTTHRWPEESRKANRACNCPDACGGPCIRRQSAFQVIKAAGAGE